VVAGRDVSGVILILIEVVFGFWFLTLCCRPGKG